MFRYGSEVGDFVLHVEWRFTKLEGDQPYNSGVFVRTGADGAIWLQAQTGAAGGYLFGNAPVNGTAQRVNLRQEMSENRVKAAGEWNTYEIRAVGKRIALWVNGAVVNEYTGVRGPSRVCRPRSRGVSDRVPQPQTEAAPVAGGPAERSRQMRARSTIARK